VPSVLAAAAKATMGSTVGAAVGGTVVAGTSVAGAGVGVAAGPQETNTMVRTKTKLNKMNFFDISILLFKNFYRPFLT
jgi:hypothetical protein